MSYASVGPENVHRTVLALGTVIWVCHQILETETTLKNDGPPLSLVNLAARFLDNQQSLLISDSPAEINDVRRRYLFVHFCRVGGWLRAAKKFSHDDALRVGFGRLLLLIIVISTMALHIHWSGWLAERDR